MNYASDGYVAAVMTVRNEHDLLRNNLLYHRFVGIDKFYIYADHPLDTSLETVSDFSWVSANRSFLPKWLTTMEVADAKRLIGRYQTHHTARQIINCHDAIRRARDDGVTWLVSIDPDELLLLNDDCVVPYEVAAYLNMLPNDVETVTFPSTEVLATRFEYQNIFAEEKYFKKRYGYGEGIRISEESLAYKPEWVPDIISSNEYIYKIKDTNGVLFCENVNNDVISRIVDVPHIFLPQNKRSTNTDTIFEDWYIGHVIGKQAFRIDRELNFRSLHTIQLSLTGRNHVVGRLLHYNCYSFSKFLSKYRSFINHPNSYAKGSPTDKLKLALRDAVNKKACENSDLLNIFRTQISFEDDRLVAVKSLWPQSVVAIPAVIEVFRTYLIR